MHYPPLADINSLLQKALFLRDPKVGRRPRIHPHRGLQHDFFYFLNFILLPFLED